MYQKENGQALSLAVPIGLKQLAVVAAAVVANLLQLLAFLFRLRAVLAMLHFGLVQAHFGFASARFTIAVEPFRLGRSCGRHYEEPNQ